MGTGSGENLTRGRDQNGVVLGPIVLGDFLYFPILNPEMQKIQGGPKKTLVHSFFLCGKSMFAMMP